MIDSALPLGPIVDATPAQRPAPTSLHGGHCALRPLDPPRDSAVLYAATHGREREALWAYSPDRRAQAPGAFQAAVERRASSTDPLFFAVEVVGEAHGWLALMRITPGQRGIEVGHGLLSSPADAELEALWDRLRRHLERARGFTLGFLFSSPRQRSVQLQRRLEGALRWRTTELQVLDPFALDDARSEIVREVSTPDEGRIAMRSPLWLVLDRHPGISSRPTPCAANCSRRSTSAAVRWKRPFAVRCSWCCQPGSTPRRGPTRRTSGRYEVSSASSPHTTPRRPSPLPGRRQGPIRHDCVRRQLGDSLVGGARRVEKARAGGTDAPGIGRAAREALRSGGLAEAVAIADAGVTLARQRARDFRLYLHRPTATDPSLAPWTDSIAPASRARMSPRASARLMIGLPLPRTSPRLVNLRDRRCRARRVRSATPLGEAIHVVKRAAPPAPDRVFPRPRALRWRAICLRRVFLRPPCRLGGERVLRYEGRAPVGRGYRRRSLRMQPLDKTEAIELLNRVLELELAGVVRYTHYALMVFGHNRIPIISWLKDQAEESLLHARRAGELVTLLGGHPSLGIGPLLESHKHSIDDILRESLSHERAALGVYYQLLAVSEGRSVLLEEYAREMIADEELHVDAVNKMLRAPGDIAPYASS